MRKDKEVLVDAMVIQVNYKTIKYFQLYLKNSIILSIGGPLAVMKNGKNLLVGVASYVSDSGCGNGIPTAFARVSSFSKWIKLNL